MANKPLGLVLDRIRRLFAGPATGEVSDEQLLDRFVGHREEAAFTALLHRHGPMVLGVCERILGPRPDAEDAFQATFLMLVVKAGSIRKRESVGSWLHGVAYRLASRAKVDGARRAVHERRAAPRRSPPPGLEAAWRELQAVLDGELERLPEKYRAPLVLCYLEGKTHEEAARDLGWPCGTVKGRLARARDLLRLRLARRGLALSAGSFATMLAVNVATAAVPAALAEASRQLIKHGVTGLAAQGGAAASRAAMLVHSALRALLLARLKAALLVALAVFLGGGAAALLVSKTGTGKPAEMGFALPPSRGG
jgi:RNA polymerase sigma factor (sigma-70 family)